MKRLRDESGQAIMLMVLCMTCLLGFMGFAGDVGILFRAKRVMQTAADAGAIAGALEVNYGDVTAAARAATAQNGVTNGSGGANVTVNNPPANGPHAGVAGYVEVIVSQPQPTFFMKMFNRSSATVKARSVAYLNPGQFCVYTLNTASSAGINNFLGIEAIVLPQCGLVDNSGINNFLGFLDISATYVGLVGSNSSFGGESITPPPTTIAPVSDPFAYFTEPSVAGCGAALTIAGGTHTVSPGCYNGANISGFANVTFSPGLYRFNGPVNFMGAGSLTGSGVTFYFNNTFTFFSGALINLSAPTDPTNAWNGILLFESRADTNTVAILGLNLSVLQGIIYMPNAALDVSGVNGIVLDDPLVVGQLNNNFGLTLTLDFGNYVAINPNSPLAQARLAE